jgi:heme/copper-type cytochrome/quinol oxidase subunit 2
MKRIKSFLLALLITLFTPVTVIAQGTTVGGITVPNPSKYGSLEQIINTLGGYVRTIVIVVFLLMLMYGGWVRLTAKDDSDKVASSTKIIVAAIVGFIIIALAPVIMQFVASLLGVSDILSV